VNQDGPCSHNVKTIPPCDTYLIDQTPDYSAGFSLDD